MKKRYLHIVHTKININVHTHNTYAVQHMHDINIHKSIVMHAYGTYMNCILDIAIKLRTHDH